MRDKHKSRWLQGCRLTLSALALGQFTASPVLAEEWGHHGGHETRTPIKHVIVIIGENRSFDHVFATYVPNRPGESVMNLLSQGIVKLDQDKNAVPGPNFEKAHQLSATDTGLNDAFLLSPPKQTFAKDQLPAPLVGGPKDSYIPNQCGSSPITTCEASLALAQQSESGLPSEYYQYLLTGGTGQTSKTPDQRITNVNALPAGPFQLTNSDAMPYDAYAASPVHRFYQMWQQLNCNTSAASRDNPSGCNGNLFAWVEVTVGAGSNGAQQPANFSTEYSPTATTTGEGATALGFYNVQKGDVPYFTSLVQKYAMSDNFHQSVNGGTGANHIMFGHADMIYFSDNYGNPVAPPDGTQVFGGTPDAGTVHEIENPNPAMGTNNWYIEDGYGAGGNGGYPPPYSTNPVSGGGSYSNCSDPGQPGVKPILDYLKSIRINANCEPGHYYLLNNYNPGYFANGKNAYTDTNPSNTPFTIPPSTRKSIGDSLNEKNISWKYYGDQWNNYVNDPYQLNWGVAGPTADEYCNICNPFQYDTSIMSHPDQVAAHIQDSVNLYSDISKHTLPAVSIVKPSGYTDGHPASSKLNLFEGFVKKIVDQVEASDYADDTAIFITFDEGGGYFDSGYVQPLDYFGDGTRIPLIVVSPFVKQGHISHEYADHVSIIKFIERNWDLRPITQRSRDNFPNPVAAPNNPYVPVNSPALSDLFDLFDFHDGGHGGQGGGWDH
ncbi:MULTISPECIES: alkaline phosphatase family protein [unclassified Bradyrhizobium]|uniref:alkaline phosphatase family protein n=1 Tax=unclassified Bradyrhizobium TaxID=2631580 RepID=UPI002479E6FF|nr:MULTISPECIES: alkaline phosphatase family protein [unclassified Bradyrhizobium]WGS18093.1 phosphoesterase [Bradyrhizobium sp. ISRA463]WGS24906.1 phosphoesterase [Bradyrhizobium sp. ISRA464]